MLGNVFAPMLESLFLRDTVLAVLLSLLVLSNAARMLRWRPGLEDPGPVLFRPVARRC